MALFAKKKYLYTQIFYGKGRYPIAFRKIREILSEKFRKESWGN